MTAKFLHMLANLLQVVEHSNTMTLIRRLARFEDPKLTSRLSLNASLLEGLPVRVKLESGC